MDIRKLQRAIVDGLEDVKAQNIVVFNTEHLSSLFERVVIASGTSNRQTKSLAASVRDAVKAIGLPPPRVEGEANGEWIIVDCGAAVVHVMQPSFREYYHLEELWGEKPVKVKLGSSKGLPKAAHASEDFEDDATEAPATSARLARAAGEGGRQPRTTRAGAGGGAKQPAARKVPASDGPTRARSPRGGASATAAKNAAGVKSARGTRSTSEVTTRSGVKSTSGVKTTAGVKTSAGAIESASAANFFWRKRDRYSKPSPE